MKNEEGRDIPSDDVSGFLRGGIITTMACFEACVVDLLDEARDTILYTRKKCPLGWTCQDCLQLKYKHVVQEQGERPGNDAATKKRLNDTRKTKPTSLFHNWNQQYTATLGEDFLATIFETSDIKYYYPVNDDKISAVIIRNKDEVVVCAMLRLFYGIRCIMGHGSATPTLNNAGTLKDFPSCEKCAGKQPIHSIINHEDEDNFQKCDDCKKPLSILENISQLSAILDECITQMGKKRVLKKSRHFPQRETFERLSDETHGPEKKKAKSIIDKYFLDIDRINSGPGIVNENYAYFHMCRIFHWLKENERMMYVTYRVLVRINQFILVLAYRMRIAVARILMDKYKLEDGIWNVPKDEGKLKKKIEKFEKKLKERVESLQKHDSAENRMMVNNMQTIQNDYNKTIVVLIICSSFIIVCVQLSIIIFKLTQ